MNGPTRRRVLHFLGGGMGLWLLAVWVPSIAAAGSVPGGRPAIPPGREEVVKSMVGEALGPEGVGISIDADRVRVHMQEDGAPQWVLFAPETDPRGVNGTELTEGVVLECGDTRPHPCPNALVDARREEAHRLARARDHLAAEIWTVQDTGVESRPPTSGPTPGSTRAILASMLDIGAAGIGLATGLFLLVSGARRRLGPEHPDRRATLTVILVLLLIVAAFLAVALTSVPVFPMHEHNSFVGRSDCAIDPRCVRDPHGAWSMTTFHVYGLLLRALPYRLWWLSGLSLAFSVLVILLAYGVTHGLLRRLGQGTIAAWGGLAAVLVLAMHPVFWRLAVAATFWPYAIACMFAAVVASLHASDKATPSVEASIAWLCAACWFALACGGNLVLLTLGPLALLAPLCWGAWPRGDQTVRRGPNIVRWAGSLAIMAGVLIPDYVAGVERAFGPVGSPATQSIPFVRVLYDFDPLLLDPRFSPLPWGAFVLLAAAWLSSFRRAVVLIPIAYGWVIPGAFLGVAAGEIVGFGYPVGFINHFWELCFTAVLAGLGAGWLIDRLGRWRPGLAKRWPVVALFALVGGGLVGYAGMREGWAVATERRVVDRELEFISKSLTTLPEHDLLVVPPGILEPLDDLPREGDPIEVVFPAGEYRHVLLERGLRPAPIVPLERFDPSLESARVLVYVGASLRSFQPHEIRAGAVRPQLERDPLLDLRQEYLLEPVTITMLPTAQHEAVTMRLGADRVPEIELGFYWLRPRPDPDAEALGSSR